MDWADAATRTVGLPGRYRSAPIPAYVRLLARHWSLLVVLAAGLALRLPYIQEGDGYDARNYSTFASSVLDWGRNFDGYHLSRYSAFPFAHPPLFPILYAPLNWLALRTGGWYVAAANGLIYAFEVAGAVVLYALARRGARSTARGLPRIAWSPGLIVGLFYLVPLTPLWLRWRGDVAPDTQYMSIAVAWLLAAVYCERSPKLAGTFFGLAMMTRTEMTVLALPFALHYVRQSLTRGAWFVAYAGGVAALVLGPFLLRDWQAVDWALRGHLAARVWETQALVWRWPWGDPPAHLLASVAPFNAALMLGAVVAATLVSWRNPWIEQRLAVVALAHALTIPVFHNQYGAHAFALGLAWAARSAHTWLAAAWFLAALRLDFNVATVGIPAVGLVWQSAVALGRSATGPAETDPLRDWAAARIRDVRRLPVWSPSAAIALFAAAVLVGRARVEPALASPTGELEVMGLLGGVPTGGVAPPFALVAWALAGLGPNAIWWLNALTAASSGAALFFLSALAQRLARSSRGRLALGTLVAAAASAWLVSRFDAVEASPVPISAAWGLGLVFAVVRRLEPVGSGEARSRRGVAMRSRAALGGMAWLLVGVAPLLFPFRGALVPIPVGEPGVARQLGGGEALALLGQSLIPSRAWLWEPNPPRSPTAYTDVIVHNLEALDRKAVVCAGEKDVWGWQFARAIGKLRPDVSVIAADVAGCVRYVIPTFAPTRPVYATSLSNTDLLESGYVFFPARGIWRAVAPWPSIGDGSIVKGPDDRIYLLDRGQKRWITSVDAFAHAGLAWDQVQLVPMELLATYPEGPPLLP